MTAKEAQRQNTYPHAPTFANTTGMLGATQAQMLRGHPYMPTGTAFHHANVNADANLAALASNFGSMNLRAASYGTTASSASQISGHHSEYAAHHALPMAANQAYWNGQQFVYPNAQMLPGMAQSNAIQHQSLYAPTHHYVHQSTFQPYGQHTHDNSPLSTNWTPRVPSGEIPSLVTPRRDSVSSNEADNLPGTPFTAGYGSFQNAVTVVDRSPSALYGHSTTPSPAQFVPGYPMPHLAKAQTPTQSPISLQLQMLLQREPAIPHAIPAPSSPMKPLDRSLENKTGETNVYIRGLMPETTDEMLQSWGDRFGDIQSAKAILDLKTELCKGFGFIKYHNFEDAENCIRGFHHLGYEVSFARESFYAKLKKFSDDNNTNLYVSNIPRSMNEHDLSCIFSPHKVCSARILRDSMGNGRGVGFARFESRDDCEEVIKIFNNKTITRGADEYTIQIRYADTHEQKALKQQTAAARQYRAQEFEYGVAQARGLIGPTGMPLALMPPQADQRSVALTGADGTNEFENHLSHDIPASSYAPRYANSALRFQARPMHGTTSLGGGVSIPQVNVPTLPKLEEDPIKQEGDHKARPATPVIARGDSGSNGSADEQD